LPWGLSKKKNRGLMRSRLNLTADSKGKGSIKGGRGEKCISVEKNREKKRG